MRLSENLLRNECKRSHFQGTDSITSSLLGLMVCCAATLHYFSEVSNNSQYFLSRGKGRGTMKTSVSGDISDEDLAQMATVLAQLHASHHAASKNKSINELTRICRIPMSHRVACRRRRTRLEIFQARPTVRTLGSIWRPAAGSPSISCCDTVNILSQSTLAALFLRITVVAMHIRVLFSRRHNQIDVALPANLEIQWLTQNFLLLHNLVELQDTLYCTNEGYVCS